MEFRQLTYFVKAAELLHFTAAANAVFITQSTLSQQIKLLEEELGIPLFDRIGKQVRLTDAGKTFLDHARNILASVTKARQAMDDLNNLVSGELRIGVTYAFTSLIIPVLPDFVKNYPNLKITLDYDAPEELERKLKASELDLVLTFHNKIDEVEIERQPLYTSRIVMVVSNKNKLAGLPSINIDEIVNLRLILPAKGFSSRDFIDELFEKHQVSPQIHIELNDMHSLLSMVQYSDQISIINAKALIGWSDLVAIPIKGNDLTRQSYITWRKGAYRSKASLIFADELTKKTGVGT